MDDPMQASMAADLEVERRLDDFARGRLTPSAASKARSRARVMREARLAFADQAARAVARADAEVVRPSARRTHRRRGFALVAAAALSLVVVGGAFAASTAGGPLYGARVWLEAVNLPSDPMARADAELSRLDTRLAELQAAVRSGDRAAVAAALAAYEQIADEALAGAGTDQALIDRLTAALDRHVAVLERVAAQVPPQAAASITTNIQKAINHNGAAIERIEAGPNGGATNGGTTDGSAGSGSAGSGSAGSGSAGSGSAGSGTPPAAGSTAAAGSPDSATPTPKVKPTPKADPTAAPAATPQPTPKAPPAKPSPRPDKTPPDQPGH
jgi:hypothetical protein